MGIMQRAKYHNTVLLSVSDGKNNVSDTQKLHNNKHSLFSSIMNFLKILRLEQDISERPKCQMTPRYISEQPSEMGHIIIIIVI